jgi:CPA2 family monovalent cation:H+ antiporter-2
VHHDISLILLISIGLGFALALGLVTQRLGLSPIVGYLLAGVAVGPHTPGFEGDPKLAAQLAEIGVILLMFGVGLHFDLRELWQVRGVAVPGAIVQSLVATALAALVAVALGRSITTGVILGLAVSVASTVVLIRVLEDGGVLHTARGHIAVGWLIVEDLFTVVVLVLLPAVKEAMDAGGAGGIVTTLLRTALNLGLMLVLVLVVGRRAVPWLLNAVARTRSRELFTLAVLATALGIATGSAWLFGASMALGAFLAGVVVAQSEVSHQAAAEALPLRDAFAVLFFVSVGMLFDPAAVLEQWRLTLGVLLVILVGKPLAALVVVRLLGRSLRTALTVSVALAQIGEFSFILGDAARGLGFLTGSDASVLVTGAMISITINPLLFRLVEPADRWVQARPRLRKLLGASAEREALAVLEGGHAGVRAIVVGYGPVGQTLTRLLRAFEIDPVLVDMNVDTVRRLRKEGARAVYGDATREDILRAAGIESAEFLVVALPDASAVPALIESAKALNPGLKVIARAHYLAERATLEGAGVAAVACEEAEVAVALADRLLRAIGVSESDLQSRARSVRDEIDARA